MKPQLVASLRPRRASEVFGQEDALAMLASLGKRSMQLRGVLLHGPSGTGKTTLARLIACSLQFPERWLEPSKADWQAFDEGSFEILERNSADFSGVDDVRELIELTEYKPLAGTRVIILDEAHKLSEAAQNALLKPVEDSPAHTVWIFCTTNAGKLIATLRKRCVVLETFPLNSEDQEALITRAGKALSVEKKDLSKFLKLCASQSISSPRDLLSSFEAWYATGKVQYLGDESNTEMIEAIRLLLRGNSSGFQKFFKENPSAEAARTIRLVACSYLKSVLLNQQSQSIARMINVIASPIPPEDPAAIAKIVASFFEAASISGTSKSGNRF